nr:hypothetical protein pmam_325 [Pithovirus mammoth]
MEQTLEKQILARNFTYRNLIRACRKERSGVEKKGKELVLSRLLYEKCGWEAWRDRAQFDYKVPVAYFDLPLSGLVRREITGQQRYLEVATFYQLLPESAVSRDKSGQIYGIYEAYTGILEALARNDPAGILIFFPRLKPQVVEEFRQEIFEQRFPQPQKYRFAAFQQLAFLLFGEEEAIRLLLRPLLPENAFRMYWTRTPAGINMIQPYYMPPDSQSQIEVLSANKGEEGPYVEDFKGLLYLIQSGCRFALNQVLFGERTGPDYFREVFAAVVRSGNEEMFNRALPLFRSQSTNFPTEFQLSNLIQTPPFEEVDPYWNEKGEIPFPIVNASWIDMPSDEELFLSDAIFSCNPRFVDFFRSIYSYGDRLIEDSLYFLYKGYEFHHNAVGAYQVLQRLNSSYHRDYFFETGNVDLINLNLSHKSQDYENDEDAPEGEEQIQVLRVIEYSFGNLSVLLNCLELLRKEEDVGQIRRVIGRILDENSKYSYLTPLSFSLLKSFIEVN